MIKQGLPGPVLGRPRRRSWPRLRTRLRRAGAWASCAAGALFGQTRSCVGFEKNFGKKFGIFLKNSEFFGNFGNFWGKNVNLRGLW